MPAVPSNGIATGQTTMTGAAVQIVNARGDRKRITLIMAGTPAATAIGGPGVAAATGAVMPATAGAQLVLETTAAIFGFGAAAAVISYIEEFA